MEKFIYYLLEHPLAVKTIGGILLAFATAPLVIMWARNGQINRIRKSYDKALQEQVDTITRLFGEITKVHEELAMTRGELAGKIAELKNKNIDLERGIEQIEELQTRVQALEAAEFSLIQKLKTYEKD